MNRVDYIGLGALAALLGFACCFQLTEQDIFWQIRAGDDLWRTGVFATSDTWTYTMRGAPWRNFPWLSTLLLRAVFGACGVEGLVLLRGASVASLCFVWGLTARRAGARLAGAATLMLVLWTAALPRLQLRPELFILGCQTALVYTWLGQTSLRTKRMLSVALVWLAANLHPGLALFVGLVSIAYLVQPWIWATWPWVLGTLASLLATPYGVRMLPYVWAHLTYSQQGLLPNPEHLATGLTYFSSSAGLATLWLCISAALSVMRGAAAPPYKRTISTVLAGVVLLALAFDRMRTWIFTCHFALAPAAAMPRSTRIPRWFACGQAVAAVILVLTAGAQVAPSWGLSLDAKSSPVLAARYLQEHHPHGRLFHNFSDGAFLVWAMRDQPLFVDPRETLFWQLEPALSEAFGSAEAMASMVQRYGIDTVLLPIPNDTYDQLGKIFPPSQWLLSYFDATHLVLTQHPPNATANPLESYSLLHPTLRADTYTQLSHRTEASDGRFMQEIGRCLADDATNGWCHLAQANFLRVAGGPNARQSALASLAKARTCIAPNSLQRPVLLAEFAALAPQQTRTR